jgi:hypothetical protein
MLYLRIPMYLWPFLLSIGQECPMRGFVKQCGEPADLEIVLEENHEIGILELE